MSFNRYEQTKKRPMKSKRGAIKKEFKKASKCLTSKLDWLSLIGSIKTPCGRLEPTYHGPYRYINYNMYYIAHTDTESVSAPLKY